MIHAALEAAFLASGAVAVASIVQTFRECRPALRRLIREYYR